MSILHMHTCTHTLTHSAVEIIILLILGAHVAHSQRTEKSTVKIFILLPESEFETKRTFCCLFCLQALVRN